MSNPNGNPTRNGKVFDGEPCSRCGMTERYLSTQACTTCMRGYANARWARFTQEERQAHNRRSRLRHKYGITQADVEVLIARQGGGCAIPGCTLKPLEVDHCHKSGRIRGILCKSHNRGLGVFKDDPNELRKAIAYLEADP